MKTTTVRMKINQNYPLYKLEDCCWNI